jgi:hypothetical protein
MKITAEQIISWEPCPRYPAALVRELVGDGVTVEQILETNEISHDDKMWLLLREQVFSGKQLHELACRFAEYALSKVNNPDPRSIEAIRVKRLWIAGKATDEELDDAREAARDDAWAAAREAARDAAWNAAWDAARDAAWDARAAARDDLLKIIKKFYWSLT